MAQSTKEITPTQPAHDRSAPRLRDHRRHGWDVTKATVRVALVVLLDVDAQNASKLLATNHQQLVKTLLERNPFVRWYLLVTAMIDFWHPTERLLKGRAMVGTLQATRSVRPPPGSLRSPALSQLLFTMAATPELGAAAGEAKAGTMDFDEISQLRRHSPAWRLLCADNAPLILSFLERVFVEDNVRSISASDLTSRLDDELYTLNQRYEPPFPKSAKAYLDD
jgi:hypothetical protein